MKRDVFTERYPGVEPEQYIELNSQIQLLYDGEYKMWGTWPEDGACNPTPEQQEKARNMWRNIYTMIRQYERNIEEDLKKLSEKARFNENSEEIIVHDAIDAMHHLIHQYHSIVEPWDWAEGHSKALIKERIEPCDSMCEINISLHTIFNGKLRSNSKAVAEFMKIFPKVVNRVQTKGGHRTEKWCWRHVFYAFKDERLAFIDYETSNAAFGRAMAELCDTLKAKNVEQTLKTLVDFPSVTDSNIITDIVNTFMPVVDIIKGREASNRNG